MCIKVKHQVLWNGGSILLNTTQPTKTLDDLKRGGHMSYFRHRSDDVAQGEVTKYNFIVLDYVNMLYVICYIIISLCNDYESHYL